MNPKPEPFKPKPQTMQRSRGGLVFKVHRLCVSLHSRLESNKEEEEEEEEEIP